MAHADPLVKNSSGAWYFDTDAGIKEILYRRVGTNENDAIDTLHSLVEAQHDYAFSAHDGNNPGLYAIKFISDPGKQNGLYWKTADNEDASPIGSFLADATSEGYTLKQGQPTPLPRLLLPPTHQTGTLRQEERATTSSRANSPEASPSSRTHPTTATPVS